MKENLKTLSREQLEKLFEERKQLLLDVRDELDRRDNDKGKPIVDVDFTTYVTT